VSAVPGLAAGIYERGRHPLLAVVNVHDDLEAPVETDVDLGTMMQGGAMSTPTTEHGARGQELLGQTVVVIGGSSGIGLETARRARGEGANVVLVARDPERLRKAALETGASRTAAFDVNDAVALERFFREVPQPIGHVLVTAGGPVYGRLLDIDLDVARKGLLEHPLLMIRVARNVAGKMGPGGSLLFMGGTGGRAASVGVAPTATAMLPPLTASLALELAPVRVNLIAAGFVDTALSASLLGGDLEARREQLRRTLPIRRVVGPADVAALAVHLMTNTALTGATYDIDGGQQLVAE
jgi:NAD(P)-dependent dehydrogenase (short-subunit alcohol dehydrogenase family)